MKCFTIDEKPPGGCLHRKRGAVYLKFEQEPFIVETQEGGLRIAPDTVDDWDNGYFVAYPSDGSKPYPIAPSFVRANYVPVRDHK